MIEIFKQKKNFNAKTLLEPPLEILAKAVYTPDEPIQTGAPINFFKLEKFAQGKQRKEKTDAANPKKATEPPQQMEILGTAKPEVVSIRSTSESLFAYLTQMSE